MSFRFTKREKNTFLIAAIFVVSFIVIFAYNFIANCVIRWPIRWDIRACWSEQIAPAKQQATEVAAEFIP